MFGMKIQDLSRNKNERKKKWIDKTTKTIEKYSFIIPSFPSVNILCL